MLSTPIATLTSLAASPRAAGGIAGVGDALLQVAGLEPSDEYIDF